MKDNEKRIEITLNAYGFTFTRVDPNPMTAKQKFRILMALIALAACGLGVWMVWIAAKLCSFPGMMLALAVVVVTVFAVKDRY